MQRCYIGWHCFLILYFLFLISTYGKKQYIPRIKDKIGEIEEYR